MREQSLLTVFVPGIPSSYSTTKEKPWKEALTTYIPMPTSPNLPVTGVISNFRVTGPQSGHFAVDLDNLCEPLFSVLVNKKGWFGGRRSNIQWFKVTKSYEGDSGCDISLLQSNPLEESFRDCDLLFSAIYENALPISAQDIEFVEWVRGQISSGIQGTLFAIQLRFGSANLNIGDIGTGAVKHLIDCLYPLIGGIAGAPEDWRVVELYVEKNASDIPSGAVKIVVSVLPNL